MGKNKNVGGLTWKHKIGYGCGDAGGCITLLLVTSYMTRYVTNVLSIPYETLASLLLIWNIWDAINDPMMGTIMDKSFAKAKNKNNKFRPWILASIPVFGFGCIAFFTVPGLIGNRIVSIAALFLLKVVYELGYTMLNIGMGSMLGVMATNDGERATLSSARGFGGTIAGLIASMAVSNILASLGENYTGYAVAGIVCTVLAAIIVFIHYAWTEERNVVAQTSSSSDNEADKIKVTDILEVFKKNRAYLALCIHSLFIASTATIYSQASSYIYPDVLGDISLLGYSSLVTTILQIFALTLAPTLAKKFGMIEFIRTALLIGSAILIGLFALMAVVDVPALAYMLIVGIGYAFINISTQMQWGLVGEAIDYNEYLTGKRTEGSIYGVFSLSRRVGSTIASSLAVLIIGWIGYNSEAANAGLAQTASTITGLKVMGLLVPAILALGSFLAFRFIWNINDDVRAKIAAWHEAKKAGTV